MAALAAARVALHSGAGKAAFAAALAAGAAEPYFALAAQYRTQVDAGASGLTTLVMALNALQIDPRRLWKAPWRWYAEEMLDGCHAAAMPVTASGAPAIDLRSFACLAASNSTSVRVTQIAAGDGAGGHKHVHGAGTACSPTLQPPFCQQHECEVHPPRRDSAGMGEGEALHQLEQLREAVRSACRVDAMALSEVLVVAYDPTLLPPSATGGSAADSTAAAAFPTAAPSASATDAAVARNLTAFTAVGAYHGDSDSVLMLDVHRPALTASAAPAAGPFWLPLPTLLAAMRCPSAIAALPGDASHRRHYCHGYLALRRRIASPVLLFHQTLLAGATADDGALGVEAAAAPATTHPAALPPAVPFDFCDEDRVASSGGESAGAASAGGPTRPPPPCLQRRRADMARHWAHAWQGAVQGVTSASGWADIVAAWATGGETARLDQLVRRFLLPLQLRTRMSPAALADGAPESAGLYLPPLARCIDKLSQLHIAETSALLRALESAAHFDAVWAAVRRFFEAGGEADEITAGLARSAGQGRVLPLPGARVEAAAAQLAAAASMRRSDVVVESLDDAPESACGVTGVDVEEAGAGDRGADAGASRRAFDAGHCAGCGISCVRISLPHVLSLYVLATLHGAGVGMGLPAHAAELASLARDVAFPALHAASLSGEADGNGGGASDAVGGCCDGAGGGGCGAGRTGGCTDGRVASRNTATAAGVSTAMTAALA